MGRSLLLKGSKVNKIASIIFAILITFGLAIPKVAIAQNDNQKLENSDISYKDSSSNESSLDNTSGKFNDPPAEISTFSSEGLDTQSDDAYLSVYKKVGDNEEEFVKSFTRQELLDNADKTNISGMHYKGNAWNITTVTTGISVETLFTLANIDNHYKAGSSVTFYSGNFTGEGALTFERLETGKYWGNTTYSANADLSSGTPINATLGLLSYATPLSDTVLDANSAVQENSTKADDKNAPILIFGRSDTEYTSKTDAAGKPYVKNVDKVVLSYEEEKDEMINSADDWARVVANVNSGMSYSGKTITLASDLNLSSLTSQVPMGNESNKFEGTLDGAGHKITGVNIISSSNYTALIGYNAGTIKNIKSVEGTITATGTLDFVAGIVGFNTGTINKVINKIVVSASSAYNVAGIAGANTSGRWTTSGGSNTTIENSIGVIESCGNEGAITGYQKVGGIAGENAGKITASYNKSKVDGLRTSGKNGVGGIVGSNGNNNTAYEEGIIDSCYNAGEVGRTGQKWVGGIAGFNNSLSTIKNCLNTGNIVSGAGYYNPIAGNQEGASNCTNNYAKEGLNHSGSSEAEVGVSKTLEELKSPEFVKSLGDKFTMPITGGDSPVLVWEDASTFTVNVYSSDQTTLLKSKSFTKDELNNMATKGSYVTQMVNNFDGAPLQVMKTQNYITMEDLFAMSGITVDGNDGVIVSDATNYVSWNQSWTDLTTRDFYWPNASYNGIWTGPLDETGKTAVAPVLALSYKRTDLRSTDGDKTTSEAAAQITDDGETASCPRWFSGAKSTTRTDLRGNRSIQNVNKVNIYKAPSITYNFTGKADNITQTIEFAQKIETPYSPKIQGYIFEGWFTDETYSQEFNFDETITKDVTAYAKLTPKTATVTYNLNGGTINGSTDPIIDNRTCGTAYTLRTATKDNARLIGWYSDNESFENMVSYINDTDENSYSLYAKWQYNATTPNQQTFDKSNPQDIIFSINCDLSKFRSFSVAGRSSSELNKNIDYTVESGSTVLTLKSSLLSTLPDGIHNVDVNFDDGIATNTLTITSAENSQNNETSTITTTSTLSKTGDLAAYTLLGLTLFAICGAVTTLILWRKDRIID